MMYKKYKHEPFILAIACITAFGIGFTNIPHKVDIEFLIVGFTLILSSNFISKQCKDQMFSLKLSPCGVKIFGIIYIILTLCYIFIKTQILPPIPKSAGILIAIVGFLVILYGLFQKTKLNKPENQFLICPQCLTPFNQKAVPNEPGRLG